MRAILVFALSLALATAYDWNLTPNELQTIRQVSAYYPILSPWTNVTDVVSWCNSGSYIACYKNDLVLQFIGTLVDHRVFALVNISDDALTTITLKVTYGRLTRLPVVPFPSTNTSRNLNLYVNNNNISVIDTQSIILWTYFDISNNPRIGDQILNLNFNLSLNLGTLRINNCGLKNIPYLGSTKIVYADDNQLTTFGYLPPSIEQVNFAYNQISFVVPQPCPTNLTILTLDSNPALSLLSIDFSTCLLVFNLSVTSCNLTSLPATIPSGYYNINFNNNNLQTLSYIPLATSFFAKITRLLTYL